MPVTIYVQYYLASVTQSVPGMQELAAIIPHTYSNLERLVTQNRGMFWRMVLMESATGASRLSKLWGHEV